MLRILKLLIDWDHPYQQGLTDHSLLEKCKDSSKAQNNTNKPQLEEMFLNMSIPMIWYKYNADNQ